MANYLLQAARRAPTARPTKPPHRAIRWSRFQRGFEARFERVRDGLSRPAGAWRWRTARCSSSASWRSSLASFALAPFLGRNFFPSVDAGQILMHARAPVGTRVEETADQFADIEKAIRQIIPPREIATHRRQHRHAGQRHQHDLQQHRHDRHAGRRHPDQADARTTADRRLCARAARGAAARASPASTFSFLPADIISQILNFGAPAPIDVQVRGSDLDGQLRAYANKLLRAHPPRSRASPTRASSSRAARRCFDVDVDRTRAPVCRPDRRATSPTALVVNLAGSGQVAPTYWLNPDNGVSYPIVMQTPQYRLDSLVGAVQPADHGAGGDVAAGAGRPRRHHAATRQRRWSRTTTSQPMVADLRHHAGPRPRRRRRRHAARSSTSWRRGACRKGAHGQAAGPGQDDGQRLLRPAVRPARRDRADLPADRRELPVVERSRSSSSPRCPRRWPASSGCCSPPARRCRCRR